MAVQPIKRSKSLIIIPDFLKRVFSLAYIGIASRIGSMVTYSTNWSTTSKLFLGLALFSAPKVSSAKVISEIAQFAIPILSILDAKSNFPLKKIDANIGIQQILH